MTNKFELFAYSRTIFPFVLFLSFVIRRLDMMKLGASFTVASAHKNFGFGKKLRVMLI